MSSNRPSTAEALVSDVIAKLKEKNKICRQLPDEAFNPFKDCLITALNSTRSFAGHPTTLFKDLIAQDQLNIESIADDIASTALSKSTDVDFASALNTKGNYYPFQHILYETNVQEINAGLEKLKNSMNTFRVKNKKENENLSKEQLAQALASEASKTLKAITQQTFKSLGIRDHKDKYVNSLDDLIKWVANRVVDPQLFTPTEFSDKFRSVIDKFYLGEQLNKENLIDPMFKIFDINQSVFTLGDSKNVVAGFVDKVKELKTTIEKNKSTDESNHQFRRGIVAGFAKVIEERLAEAKVPEKPSTGIKPHIETATTDKANVRSLNDSSYIHGNKLAKQVLDQLRPYEHEQQIKLQESALLYLAKLVAKKLGDEQKREDPATEIVNSLYDDGIRTPEFDIALTSETPSLENNSDLENDIFSYLKKYNASYSAEKQDFPNINFSTASTPDYSDSGSPPPSRQSSPSESENQDKIPPIQAKILTQKGARTSRHSAPRYSEDDSLAGEIQNQWQELDKKVYAFLKSQEGHGSRTTSETHQEILRQRNQIKELRAEFNKLQDGRKLDKSLPEGALIAGNIEYISAKLDQLVPLVENKLQEAERFKLNELQANVAKFALRHQENPVSALKEIAAFKESAAELGPEEKGEKDIVIDLENDEDLEFNADSNLDPLQQIYKTLNQISYQINAELSRPKAARQNFMATAAEDVKPHTTEEKEYEKRGEDDLASTFLNEAKKVQKPTYAQSVGSAVPATPTRIKPTPPPTEKPITHTRRSYAKAAASYQPPEKSSKKVDKNGYKTVPERPKNPKDASKQSPLTGRKVVASQPPIETYNPFAALSNLNDDSVSGVKEKKANSGWTVVSGNKKSIDKKSDQTIPVNPKEQAQSNSQESTKEKLVDNLAQEEDEAWEIVGGAQAQFTPIPLKGNDSIKVVKTYEELQGNDDGTVEDLQDAKEQIAESTLSIAGTSLNDELLNEPLLDEIQVNQAGLALKDNSKLDAILEKIAAEESRVLDDKRCEDKVKNTIAPLTSAVRAKVANGSFDNNPLIHAAMEELDKAEMAIKEVVRYAINKNNERINKANNVLQNKMTGFKDKIQGAIVVIKEDILGKDSLPNNKKEQLAMIDAYLNEHVPKLSSFIVNLDKFKLDKTESFSVDKGKFLDFIAEVKDGLSNDMQQQLDQLNQAEEKNIEVIDPSYEDDLEEEDEDNPPPLIDIDEQQTDPIDNVTPQSYIVLEQLLLMEHLNNYLTRLDNYRDKPLDLALDHIAQEDDRYFTEARAQEYIDHALQDKIIYKELLIPSFPDHQDLNDILQIIRDNLSTIRENLSGAVNARNMILDALDLSEEINNAMRAIEQYIESPGDKFKEISTEEASYPEDPEERQALILEMLKEDLPIHHEIYEAIENKSHLIGYPEPTEAFSALVKKSDELIKLYEDAMFSANEKLKAQPLKPKESDMNYPGNIKQIPIKLSSIDSKARESIIYSCPSMPAENVGTIINNHNTMAVTAPANNSVSAVWTANDPDDSNKDEQFKGILLHLEFSRINPDINKTMILTGSFSINTLKQVTESCLAEGRAFRFGDNLQIDCNGGTLTRDSNKAWSGPFDSIADNDINTMKDLIKLSASAEFSNLEKIAKNAPLLDKTLAMLNKGPDQNVAQIANIKAILNELNTAAISSLAQAARGMVLGDYVKAASSAKPIDLLTNSKELIADSKKYFTERQTNNTASTMIADFVKSSDAGHGIQDKSDTDRKPPGKGYNSQIHHLIPKPAEPKDEKSYFKELDNAIKADIKPGMKPRHSISIFPGEPILKATNPTENKSQTDDKENTSNNSPGI